MRSIGADNVVFGENLSQVELAGGDQLIGLGTAFLGSAIDADRAIEVVFRGDEDQRQTFLRALGSASTCKVAKRPVAYSACRLARSLSRSSGSLVFCTSEGAQHGGIGAGNPTELDCGDRLALILGKSANLAARLDCGAPVGGCRGLRQSPATPAGSGRRSRKRACDNDGVVSVLKLCPSANPLPGRPHSVSPPSHSHPRTCVPSAAPRTLVARLSPRETWFIVEYL